MKRMKLQRNTSFAIAATLLFAGFANLTAQTAPNVKMGLRVSPNFSWINIQKGSMSNDGLGLGFSYGVTADFAMFKSTNYWLATELSVSTIPVLAKSNTNLIRVVPQQGSTGKMDTLTYLAGDVNFKYNCQYLQIPLSVKMKTDEIGNMKYYFQFGLAPSFMMKRQLSTTKLKGADIYPSNTGITSHDPNSKDDDGYQFNGITLPGTGKNETQFSFIDNIATFRFPVIMGVGVEYKLTGNTMFTAGLRFDNAINNFFKDPTNTKDPNIIGKSNLLAIQAGILF
jgi:hypothetical protein